MDRVPAGYMQSEAEHRSQEAFQIGLIGNVLIQELSNLYMQINEPDCYATMIRLKNTKGGFRSVQTVSHSFPMNMMYTLI